MTSNPNILELKDVSKSFAGVQALSNISFDVREGEILGFIGENGAGKSTLIKILAGAHQRDSGEILFSGKPFHVQHPKEAQDIGISVIYQEFNLIPSLSVAENIFLGKLPLVNKMIHWKKLYSDATAALERLNLKIDVTIPVSELSIAKQQMVEIAKALVADTKILIMDEPTATLTGEETETLLQQVQQLKAEGITVIFVSHRLEELFAVCDRIAVLRDGKFIGTYDSEQLTKDKLIELMVGRPLSQTFPERKGKLSNETILEVRNLTRGQIVKDVSFSLSKGEILGIAGLVGSGRTETARLIFGADLMDSGEVLLKGKKVSIRSPQEAIAQGIGLVPEDRKNQGLVIGLSVRENLLMSSIKKAIKNGFILRKREAAICETNIASLQIKTSHYNQLAESLSGGNQQKVVLGKWLNAEPDIIIMDEPTRGIDVNAKVEIYKLIVQLADAGKSLIIISSELPEILGLSDNILVMCEGEISGRLSKSEATQEKIMYHATGGR